MVPVEQFETEGTTLVVFAKDQPEYIPLPALVYPDGVVLIEWALSEEERAAIVHGENLRLWIWKGHVRQCSACGHHDPALLTPIMLEVTSEKG